MTAAIVILNREAVALAADSAASIATLSHLGGVVLMFVIGAVKSQFAENRSIRL